VYVAKLRALTATSNERLLQLVERSSASFERDSADKYAEFDSATNRSFCQQIRADLLQLRNSFVVHNVGALLEATGGSRRPVLTQS
jgi:hypothetical protein